MHINIGTLVSEWNQLRTFEKHKFCYRMKNCSIKSRQFSVSTSLVFDKTTIRISSTEKIFYGILKNILTVENEKLNTNLNLNGPQKIKIVTFRIKL